MTIRWRGSSAAMRGSYRSCTACMRSPISPAISAMMTIPGFTPARLTRSGIYRRGEREPAAVRRMERSAEEPFVEFVAGAHAVMIAHDLVPGERADHRPHHDVARPVA